LAEILDFTRSEETVWQLFASVENQYL